MWGCLLTFLIGEEVEEVNGVHLFRHFYLEVQDKAKKISLTRISKSDSIFSLPKDRAGLPVESPASSHDTTGQGLVASVRRPEIQA